MVPARFNGPPGSANGGYMCGSVAQYLSGPCAVRIHRPPLLDRPFGVEARPDRVDVRDGDLLIAHAAPCSPLAAPPPAPTMAAAQAARHRYAGVEDHDYARCFVCGKLRDDGLHIFAGPVEDDSLVACDWVPDSEFWRDDGTIDPVIVWAALDCPSFFGLRVPLDRLYLLGEMRAVLHHAVPGRTPLIVYAWSRGIEGRKLLAASALATPEGRVVAQAEHVWIAPKG